MGWAGTDAVELISRVRDHGAEGITAADREAFRFRPGEGRRVRLRLVDLLLTDFRKTDLPLLRALIREETIARERYDGCGKVLYALALMLYALGELEDVLTLHTAKFANMDAGVMIDWYMLRMGRSEAEVTAFVRDQLASQPAASPWSAKRVIEDIRDAFRFDDYKSREECLRSALHTVTTYDDDDEEDEDEDWGG